MDMLLRGIVNVLVFLLGLSLVTSTVVLAMCTFALLHSAPEALDPRRVQGYAVAFHPPVAPDTHVPGARSGAGPGAPAARRHNGLARSFQVGQPAQHAAIRRPVSGYASMLE